MLYPRIIPCLLISDKGLVKTINFKNPKYVGDPINAVRIFNEKEVDELMVLDIDATRDMREPDYKMIEHLAAECRMPLCYGGGVTKCEQIQHIIQLGVEKVALSSSAIENPHLIPESSKIVGNQSVVVVLDVKRKFFGSKYEVYTHNGKKATGKDPVDVAVQMENLGAGELVVNSIDNDGLMNGYDIELIGKLRAIIGIPLTVLGGAGSIEHIGDLIQRFGAIGASAGSLFVFKGKYRAVLINYPNNSDKEDLLRRFYDSDQFVRHSS